MEYPTALLSGLRPEVQVLLLAAGPPEVEEDLRSLVASAPIDWDVLTSLADLERATAIVWRRIRPYAPPGMSAEVRERFDRLAMVADFSASYLEQRTGETLARLNALGVEPLALKGVALATTVYGSFFDRPMGDVDLLLPPERAQALWEGVQEAGWEWVPARYPLENYVGHSHLAPLLDTRGRILRLELHSALFVEGSPFALSAADLAAHGTVVEVGEGRMIVPCREHLLLHACIHFAWSHMMTFGTWRAFRDVVALTSAGVHWGMFEEEARRNRAESTAYWTLRLAGGMSGAAIPGATMERLSRAADSPWRRACERHLQRELFPIGARCPSHMLRRWLWEAAIRPGAAGHGRGRPWVLDEAHPPAEGVGAEGGAGEGEGGRLAQRVGQVGALWRYVRMLAG